MPVWVRYAAFQVPEAVIAALVLWGLYAFLDWSGSLLWALFAVWIAKEVVLYPFVKGAYDNRPSPHVGAERLLGAVGVVDQALDPEGVVRVRGELWRAELLGGGPLARGATVAVHSVRDLTLVVRADDG